MRGRSWLVDGDRKDERGRKRAMFQRDIGIAMYDKGTGGWV